MIRVLVADNRPQVRARLRRILDLYAGLEPAGEVTSARKAVRAALDDRPDVLILNPALPAGFAATAQLGQLAPGVAVLALTTGNDDRTAFAALRAGARGYLATRATTEQTVQAITAAAAGTATVGPAVAARMLGYLTAARELDLPVPQLTPRELGVLDLLAQGKPRQAIANRLGLSPETVNRDTARILVRLRATTRARSALHPPPLAPG